MRFMIITENGNDLGNFITKNNKLCYAFVNMIS